jgi:hypothetical protein
MVERASPSGLSAVYRPRSHRSKLLNHTIKLKARMNLKEHLLGEFLPEAKTEEFLLGVGTVQDFPEVVEAAGDLLVLFVQ